MYRSRSSVLLAAAVPFAVAHRAQRWCIGLTKWWHGEEPSLRALAALDDEHLGDLSELGQRLRRKARQEHTIMKTRPSTWSIAAYAAATSALTAALLGGTGSADAAEIRLLSAAAMQSVFKEIAGEFERASGHRLIIAYGTIGGITQRVLDGEVADVVIASTVSMPALVKAGKIDAGSQVTICKTGIGIVVPAGTPKPRVASVEDFKQAVLAAKTIVYADPVRGGAAGVHVAKVLQQLGIAEQLKPTIKVGAGGDVTEVTLAQGNGALGITQISEIVGKLGAEFVGLLPDELQNYTIFVAGTPTGRQRSEAISAFVSFLKQPRAIAAIEAKGMQPD
ncbi:MAG: molybdate ABC transporter substrate-binding protein [Xanthobacteraceae bacterium]